MIGELLQDRAALYVSGAMTERERAEFELLLEFHEEIRQFVTGLQEVGSALLLANPPPDLPQLSAGLKAKILHQSFDRPQQSKAEALVMTGPDRLVQWVNPAFVEMCGYSLEELRGKQIGPILQGEKSDAKAVAKMRTAVHERLPCRVEIVNYRKDGSPYWVDIAITPILDDAGEPLWFVAQERELALPMAA